jgi:hypothetical protein
LSLFEDASSSEVKMLSMLACFKRYPFIEEFSVEVLRRKFLRFDDRVLDSDYAAFYDSKCAAHDNLAQLSESTKKKIRQVMFRILTQAGFLDDARRRTIQRPWLSQSLTDAILRDSPRYLRCFLYSDSEIETLLERRG